MRTARRAAAATPAEVTRIGFAPIVRVDPERREIELCATSESVDTYGTVFAYEASRDAFDRWAGNVREMHERKAVGRRVAVRCDDQERKVYVRVRISKGAEDTWEKVRDGTLRGASIGASNVEWRTERRAGREIPVARRYDLVELSLVDLPSNPDALGVTFVRDGVPLPEVLDELDPAAPVPLPQNTPSLEGQRAPVAPADDETTEERIAREALAAGRVQLDGAAHDGAAADEQPPATASERAIAPVAALGARAARLAALGAPDYSARAASPHGTGSVTDGDGAEGDGAEGARDAGSHAPDRYTHDAHDHTHTGEPFAEDDIHRHTGPHLHLDGTSHTHEHSHDHQHGDHAGRDPRGRAGHSHSHIHSHDHGHAYRVADGTLLDERLVLAGARWAGEYIGEAAFRMAEGIAGVGLAPAQARIALALDRVLTDTVAAAQAGAASTDAGVASHQPLLGMSTRQPVVERALGAYSNNPDGPPDTGVPAAAAQRPTGAAYSQTPEGNREVVLHTAARGILLGCGCPACQVALAALDDEGMEDAGRVAAGGREAAPGMAQMTRALEAHTRRLDTAIHAVHASVGQVAGTLRELDRRVATIEAQPMPGGPQLRIADKTHALLPHGGQPGVAEQVRALESLAGRLSDPQAQIAVATEMIRLQQAAAGLPAALQAMPRAGSGAGGR